MENLSLVNQAKIGNEKAFETLVKNESEKLYKTAFLYVRNKEDALDIVQETIYKAFISIGQIEQPEFFNTWLTRILIRTAYDVIKKQKKVVFNEIIINDIKDDINTDVDTKMDIVNAVSSLSRNYQTVIILFYYHDLPINEIAKIIGKPENTIKTYLRRARKELKIILLGVSYSGQRAFS